MTTKELIRQEIERLEEIDYPVDTYEQSVGFYDALDRIKSFLDTLPDGLVSDDLEEAADDHIRKVADAAGHPGWDWTTQDIAEAFKAGAEWQKEQDQPITGNSLEQEWLRYVDKEKKECGGELPALGEYGWLRIARHFANWQKAKMMEGAVEGKVFMSFAPGHNQMVMADVDLPTNTKVKVIIVKEDK